MTSGKYCNTPTNMINFINKGQPILGSHVKLVLDKLRNELSS